MSPLELLARSEAEVRRLQKALSRMRCSRNEWKRKALVRKPRGEWAKRRNRENGRPRYSPCVECGSECRGVRCKDCVWPSRVVAP